MAKLTLVPMFQQNCLNSAELKFDPLSVMISWGTPKRCTMPWMKLTAVAESKLFIGFASIHFVNLSTATRICVNQDVPVLSGPIMSNPHVAKGHAKCIVFNSEAGLCGWFLFLQISQNGQGPLGGT